MPDDVQQLGVERNGSDLAIMLSTALIFSIFIVGLASVCYRWTSRRFYPVEPSVNLSTHSEHELRRTVWRARTARGIDAATVKSFQTFLYSEVKEQRIGKGGVECVVCLCEFQDDDTLSLMPNCCHVYHADCVSVWLSDHSTCPLCRVDLDFQQGEGSDPDPELGVVDSTEARLSERMTWTDWRRQFRSRSLSYNRVSYISFSRSHSTGHCGAESVGNLDRFTLRLPNDVRRRLRKKTVVRTQVRSSRGFYRSRSVGSNKRNVLSEQWCNYQKSRRSMTYSFTDRCVWSVGDDVVAPPNSAQSSRELRPDDQV